MDASSLMGGSPGMMSGASQVNGGSSSGGSKTNIFNPMGSMMGGSTGSGGGTSGPMNMLNSMMSTSGSGRTSSSSNVEVSKSNWIRYTVYGNG